MNELGPSRDAGPDSEGRQSSPWHLTSSVAPRAAVHCDDAALEPHHLLAEITSDGLRTTAIDRACRCVLMENHWSIPHAGGRRGWSSRPQRAHGAGRSHRCRSRAEFGQRRGVAFGQGCRADHVWPLMGARPVGPPSSLRIGGATSGGVLPAVLAGRVRCGGSAAAPTDVPDLRGSGAIVAIGTWGGQRFSMLHRRRRRFGYGSTSLRSSNETSPRSVRHSSLTIWPRIRHRPRRGG